MLSEGKITPADLDHIGISRDPKANLMQAALFAFRTRPTLNMVRDRLSNTMKVGTLKTEFAKHLNLDVASLKADFHNVEHHRAHMASAFFVSPYDEAAILSVDGAGDFVTTMWGTGKGNKLNVTGEINFPHSLGIFYTAVSQWLGFPKYGDEGKVMGLAPYGSPIYMDAMHKLVRVQRDGTFELDLDYFAHHVEGAAMSWEGGEPTIGLLYSPKLIDLLGDPRVPRSRDHAAADGRCRLASGHARRSRVRHRQSLAARNRTRRRSAWRAASPSTVFSTAKFCPIPASRTFTSSQRRAMPEPRSASATTSTIRCSISRAPTS